MRSVLPDRFLEEVVAAISGGAETPKLPAPPPRFQRGGMSFFISPQSEPPKLAGAVAMASCCPTSSRGVGSIVAMAECGTGGCGGDGFGLKGNNGGTPFGFGLAFGGTIGMSTGPHAK